MGLEILRKIGLSDGEIKVYSALLDLGLSPLNKIHERVGIERRNIYDILNKLIERGLVSYIFENKKRLFKVSNPDNIINCIEEKKNALDETKKVIEKEVPLLIEKYNLKKTEINAEIYRGIEGIKAVWEDCLNSDGIYWIGSGRYIPKKIPVWFDHWNKKRIKLKVKLHNLFRYEMKKEVKQFYKMEEGKFLPREFSGAPTVICIFSNKVVNFIFGTELFAFVIESKEIAENYKAYHKYLWDNVAKL